jgi:hypothetical protein
MRKLAPTIFGVIALMLSVPNTVVAAPMTSGMGAAMATAAKDQLITPVYYRRGGGYRIARYGGYRHGGYYGGYRRYGGYGGYYRPSYAYSYPSYYGGYGYPYYARYSYPYYASYYPYYTGYGYPYYGYGYRW